MTNQALEEYKRDSANIKKDRIILEEFYKAVKIQDKNKAEGQIKKIKELPFLTYKKDVFVHTEDGMIISYQSRPWKARDLYKKELMITEENEEMHPYLAEFFDISVRENMTSFDDWMLKDFKESAPKGQISRYDGNYEIAIWLDEYAKTSVLLQDQGKEIIEPQTFQEYPCLKQFVDRKIENLRNDNKSLDALKKRREFEQKIEMIRRERRIHANTISDAVVADKIAKDMISGKEKGSITPKVGKELSDKIKKEYALIKKQNE